MSLDPADTCPFNGSVIVGGDNRGDIATGGSKINKQRYRFFLPFMFFGHAAKQAAAHWVVTTVTVVVVIGGVSSGIALPHKGANTPAPSPTASAAVATTPALSAANWSQLHGAPARTGYQPDETRIGTGNVSKLSLARTYKTNGPRRRLRRRKRRTRRVCRSRAGQLPGNSRCGNVHPRPTVDLCDRCARELGVIASRGERCRLRRYDNRRDLMRRGSPARSARG